MAISSFNNSFNSSIGMTPFEGNYCSRNRARPVLWYEVRGPLSYLVVDSKDVSYYIKDLIDIRLILFHRCLAEIRQK